MMSKFAFPVGLVLAVAVGCSPATEPAANAEPMSDPALDGQVLFVGNKREDTLSKIDLATGAEVVRVDTCDDPHELSVSPDGRYVALACYGGTSIDLFTTDTVERVGSVELGRNARPHGIVWHANGQIVATAEGRGTMFVVGDPLSDEPRVREIGTNKGPGPHMVVVDEAFATAWGVVIPTGEVIRYDLATGEETGRHDFEGQAEAVALSPDETALWVGSNSGGTAYRMDPSTLTPLKDVATGLVPIRIAMHPGGKWAVTSNVQDGTLSVIDTEANETVRTILVSETEDTTLVTLVFSSDGERLYAAQTRSNMIAEVEFATGKVLRRFPTGEGGDGLAVMSQGFGEKD